MNQQYIVHFISKTKKKMTEFLDHQLHDQGLEDLIPSHGNILTVLYNHGELSMKKISGLIGKDKSTVTALISSLYRLGYVKKTVSPEDKRVTYISLTEKGRAIEDKYLEISKEVQDTTFKGFSEGEREEFLRLLKKINVNFNEALRNPSKKAD